MRLSVQPEIVSPSGFSG